VHFVSIASAFVSFETPHFYAEHFCNSLEPVVNIGPINNISNVNGKMITRRGKGHLLVSDYLYNIARGDFGKTSRFYKQIKNSDMLS